MHRRLITGGYPITVDRVPFMVRIYTQAQSTGFCGGTLLSARSVLTAAHCVQPAPTGDLYVGTQQTEIFGNTAFDERGDMVRVKDIVTHPEYTSVEYGNDVAILHLERTPHFYEAGWRILLDDGTHWPATGNGRPPSNASYVAGYGSLVYGGPQSLYLRVAHVRMYTRTQCATMHGFVPAPSNLCAGLDGADSCEGDSGGPLFVAHDGTYVQTGVVSWGVAGYECGTAESPGMYSLVASARTFITSHVSDASFAGFLPEVEGDACECATDCVSNGFSVAPRCGCAPHVGESESFCYTKLDSCPQATYSTFVVGATWRPCEVSPPRPPPLPPPFLPPSPPPLPPPLPSLENACVEIRTRHTQLQCCTQENSACAALRDSFHEYGCC